MCFQSIVFYAHNYGRYEVRDSILFIIYFKYKKKENLFVQKNLIFRIRFLCFMIVSFLYEPKIVFMTTFVLLMLFNVNSNSSLLLVSVVLIFKVREKEKNTVNKNGKTARMKFPSYGKYYAILFMLIINKYIQHYN